MGLSQTSQISLSWNLLKLLAKGSSLSAKVAKLVDIIMKSAIFLPWEGYIRQQSQQGRKKSREIQKSIIEETVMTRYCLNSPIFFS